MEAPGRRIGLYGAWLVSCAWGELVGFVLAAGLSYALLSAESAPTSLSAQLATFYVILDAGALHGLVVGAAQWYVLRKRYSGLEAGTWVALSIGVAAACWLLATLPSVLGAGGMRDPAPPFDARTRTFAPAFGALIGALFGLAQWSVLRRYAEHSWLWIASNILGWALGLPLVYFAVSSLGVRGGIGRLLMLGAGAGALLGLPVAALTAMALALARPRANEPTPSPQREKESVGATSEALSAPGRA